MPQTSSAKPKPDFIETSDGNAAVFSALKYFYCVKPAYSRHRNDLPGKSI